MGKQVTLSTGAVVDESPQVVDGRAAILLCRDHRGNERMRMYNLLLLLTAITIEICGDASIRVALRHGRPVLFLLGAVLLIGYGTFVSFPTWTFSRTMGVYIAVFFIVSQVVAAVVLREQIKPSAIVGGVLIVSGGLVILWKGA